MMALKLSMTIAGAAAIAAGVAHFAVALATAPRGLASGPRVHLTGCSLDAGATGIGLAALLMGTLL